jgi:hypothetical protein
MNERAEIAIATIEAVADMIEKNHALFSSFSAENAVDAILASIRLAAANQRILHEAFEASAPRRGRPRKAK